MSTSSQDPTQRFSDRVANYVRYRPNYPRSVLTVLEEQTGFTWKSLIADVGAGTGISTELFLRNGNPVYAVEPNREMLRAAVEAFHHYPTFWPLLAPAENTTLDDQSVDYVVAAHAFHWFDVPKAKQEFSRILRDDGWLVLMWNTLRKEATPFLQDYEQLLQQYGTDYKAIQHINMDTLPTFFTKASFGKSVLDNEQRFDFESLKGRLLSSSYSPNEGHPDHEPMLQALAHIFEQHKENGQVRFEYDLEIFFGKVAES